jgi:lipopolysaccharide export system protein LptC
MRDRLTTLIAIVLLAVVTATSYWYARVLHQPVAAEAAAPGTPDFEAEKMVVTQFDAQGRARHRLFAERLLHFQETDNVELTAPRLVSLRPDEPQVEVRADRGDVENAGERVHLRGNVVATRAAWTNSPALLLRTDYLLAVPDYDRYSTDRPVQVERDGTRIDAAGGMSLDNIARTLQFRGGVRMLLPARAPEER